MDNDVAYEITPGEGDSEDFDSQIKRVLHEAFPVLMDRLRYAAFADWHRQNGLDRDLAQEAAFLFMKHVRRRRAFPTDTVGYLVRIAQNLAKKHHRQRDTDAVHWGFFHEPWLLDIAEVGELDPERNGEADPRLQAMFDFIRDAIETLPSRQKEAMLLHLQSPGATQRELGARMGIGEDGFRKNVERAMDSIRIRMRTRGIIQ